MVFGACKIAELSHQLKDLRPEKRAPHHESHVEVSDRTYQLSRISLRCFFHSICFAESCEEAAETVGISPCLQ